LRRAPLSSWPAAALVEPCGIPESETFHVSECCPDIEDTRERPPPANFSLPPALSVRIDTGTSKCPDNRFALDPDPVSSTFLFDFPSDKEV
jgi:hypothetical protein